MLSECLREQKHSKVKLMKACRLAKQEIEALKNNGMAQLLDDMQGKCRALEAANERLERELTHEKATVRSESAVWRQGGVTRVLVLLGCRNPRERGADLAPARATSRVAALVGR